MFEAVHSTSPVRAHCVRVVNPKRSRWTVGWTKVSVCGRDNVANEAMQVEKMIGECRLVCVDRRRCLRRPLLHCPDSQVEGLKVSRGRVYAASGCILVESLLYPTTNAVQRYVSGESSAKGLGCKGALCKRVDGLIIIVSQKCTGKGPCVESVLPSGLQAKWWVTSKSDNCGPHAMLLCSCLVSSYVSRNFDFI